MKPVSRFGVNKRSSASKFKRDVSKTKGPNLPRTVMRGGWRF